MAIDVGMACIFRAGNTGSSRTIVQKDNTANADGTVNSVCVFAQTDITGLEFGVFIDNGGNSLTCKGNCNGSNLSATIVESPKTFTAPGDFTAFAVETGQHAGSWNTVGSLEKGGVGGGRWYATSDKLDTDITFTFTSSSTNVGVYMTGTEAAGGETIVITNSSLTLVEQTINTNAQTLISIANATLTTVGQVLYTNIKFIFSPAVLSIAGKSFSFAGDIIRKGLMRLGLGANTR